jgi:hypothetical protein
MGSVANLFLRRPYGGHVPFQARRSLPLTPLSSALTEKREGALLGARCTESVGVGGWGLVAARYRPAG